MKIQIMKLSELKKPEKNVRMHTATQLEQFERSVRMFGQIRPIVVDENNVILAGNGLYDTLLKMGRDTAEVYRYNDLTENQKKKLMIADNKIFSLGIDNLETLNAFFEDLKGDLDIPGFDEEILKQMVADAEEVTEKISEYGTLDEEKIKQIKEDALRTENKIRQKEEQTSEQTAEERNEETTGESTEEKFVVCPNCGEKIWL